MIIRHDHHQKGWWTDFQFLDIEDLVDQCPDVWTWQEEWQEYDFHQKVFLLVYTDIESYLLEDLQHLFEDRLAIHKYYQVLIDEEEGEIQEEFSWLNIFNTVKGIRAGAFFDWGSIETQVVEVVDWLHAVAGQPALPF